MCFPRLDRRLSVCYNGPMKAIKQVAKFRPEHLDSEILRQREAILDYKLYTHPVVVAQRIEVEYLKKCKRFPKIFLKSTLIL